MQKPLINILTRTSNRPNGFDMCVNSIKNQTYENINHIVSYDDDLDLNYINNYNVSKIKINREEIIKNDKSVNPNNPNFWFSPHNLYCNSLLDEVKDGYIMFLDDDDMLLHENVIEVVVNNIVDEDTILIWKMQYPDGRLLPDSNSYNTKNIRLGGIGSPCFLFHSKWKDLYRWDAYKCGDYRFLEKLYKKIPNNKWINSPFIILNNSGGLGKKEDIKS